MNFIISLLLVPDFKTIVNWPNLRREDVCVGDSVMEQLPVVRNFVILTALKIQQIMGELTETQQLNAKLEEEHLQMKETELSQEIMIN